MKRSVALLALVLVMANGSDARADPTTRRIGGAVTAAGGIGVLLGFGFGVSWMMGRCPPGEPHCNDGMGYAAGVSLGLGAVLLAVGLPLLLTNQDDTTTAPAGTKPAAMGGHSLSLTF